MDRIPGSYGRVTRRSPGWAGAVISIAFLIFGAAAASATEYFVDFSSGSDANAGTSQSAPWQHAPGDGAAAGIPAGTALAAGDIVTFRGGVQYNGSLSLNQSGTAAQKILYRGDAWGTGAAIVDGQGTGSIGITVNASYVRIEGFEIRNWSTLGVYHDSNMATDIELVGNKIHDIGPWPTAAASPSGSAVYMRFTANLLVQGDEHYYIAGDALRVLDSSDAVIRGNHFHDGQVDAINGGSTGTLTIDGNTINNFTNITTHGDAMQIMQGDVVTVSNNYLYDNTQDIYFDTYSSGMTTGYIFNNVVVNTIPGTNGQSGWYNGIVIDNRYHPIGALYVYENTLVNLNAGSGGFRNLTGYAIGTVVFHNNIFYNSTNNVDATAVTTLAMDNNDYYDTFQAGVLPGSLTLAQFQAANPTLEQHSISSTPLLDQASLYAPLTGSPTIGAGMPLADTGGTSFATDYSGAARPSVNGWDQGAFQFGTAVVVAAPAAPTGLHLVP